MSLVSMANSGGISKRPILPATQSGAAWAFTPEYAWPTAHGATVLGRASVLVKAGLDARSAPTVGGAGGPDQHVAQLAKFGRRGALVERRGDVLRCASHLVNTVREVGGILGRQHHRVGRQGPGLTPIQR